MEKHMKESSIKGRFENQNRPLFHKQHFTNNNKDEGLQPVFFVSIILICNQSSKYNAKYK